MSCAKVSLILLGLVGLCFGDVPYPPDVSSNLVGGNLPSAAPVPYPLSHAAAPSAPFAPAPVYSKWEDPEGFSLQSGYEGYLVPSEHQPQTFSLAQFVKTAGILSLITPLAKFGLSLGWKVGFYAIGFVGLFFAGALVTTTVCAFTPLCSISFLGLRGLDKESVRTFITEDRINTATRFVYEAIQKFKDMNKKNKEEVSK